MSVEVINDLWVTCFTFSYLGFPVCNAEEMALIMYLFIRVLQKLAGASLLEPTVRFSGNS